MLLVFDEELDILRDMQPLDRDAFNYLADRVCFETGIVGIPRRVSYGGMALDLSERDQARRSKDKLLKLSTSQIQNAVKRLVSAGLLDRLSGKTRGSDLVLRRIFWVKALDQDSSKLNPDARQMLGRLSKVMHVFKLSNNDLHDANKLSCQSKAVSDATTLKEQQQQGNVDNFVMFLEWRASDDELAMIFRRAGVDQSKIKPEWVSEFIAYWWGEGKRAYNQREWTQRYAAKMVAYLRDPGRFDALHSMGAGKQRIAGAEHYPDYARPPRDDAQLVSWMAKHGYGMPLLGHSYQQARAHLRGSIEKRLTDERRTLS